jgi:hypothetical protein
MKKLIKWILLLAVVALASWKGYGYFKSLSAKKQDIPVTSVAQGDVVIRAFTRGELRTLRSDVLSAPNLNGTVQVTRLAPLGAWANEKDLIVEFDDSEVAARIEETRLGLESTDESIKKSEAELAIRNNQDEVDLLSKQFAVKRAELQMKRNELLGTIDQKKNKLALDEANQSLAQFLIDMKARREQADASLALSRQTRQRNAIELARDEQRLLQTKLLANMSGLVSIRQNSFGGMRQMGAQIPDIREGDQVQPGMPVAEVLDLSEMELVAKVGELDRANLVEGQEALIQLDALAGKLIRGKIKSLSSTATANVMAGDPSKKFDVIFSIDMPDLLKAVGAKPEQISRIMATAEKNRARASNTLSRPSEFGMMMGGFPGGAEGGFPGGMNGGLQAFGMQQFGGAAGGRGGDAAQSGAQRRQSQGAGRGGEDAAQAGSARGGERQGGERAAGGDRGSQGNGQRGGGRGGDFAAMMAMGRGGTGTRFTQEDLENAKLPSPPGEDSGVDILLRPGLLADVEIVVEKMPNAIHIPAQAVFEKDGKSVVYVKGENGFEPRVIKLAARRSESTMVISSGVKPGEVIALSDPTGGAASKGSQKNSNSSSGGAGVGAVAPKS